MRVFSSIRGAMQIGLIAELVLGLDQVTKLWLLYAFQLLPQPFIRVTSYFSLVMVWNHGVSFGMLSQGSTLRTYLLIMLAVTISLFMLRLALKTPSALERVGYAMVIGGAMSNALDRIRVGAVADFFYFHVGNLGWPAFNMADSCICIGVGLLLIYLLKHPARA
jgi:signal peptidase II